MTLDGVWIWIERLAVVAAAGASLIAVHLGRIAIREGREERELRERGRASRVLNTAGLLRRRMVGWWGTSVPAATVWPDGVEFDSWLESIRLDQKYVAELLERCTSIDTEAANYAELVWRYVHEMQFTLSAALRSWKQNVSGQGRVQPHVERMWGPHRLRIASAIEAAIAALDLIEDMFPAHVHAVGGMPRDDHLFKTDETIRKASEAMARARIESGAYGGPQLWQRGDS